MKVIGHVFSAKGNVRFTLYREKVWGVETYQYVSIQVSKTSLQVCGAGLKSSTSILVVTQRIIWIRNRTWETNRI
jgi:hypothetical protein